MKLHTTQRECARWPGRCRFGGPAGLEQAQRNPLAILLPVVKRTRVRVPTQRQARSDCLGDADGQAAADTAGGSG